MTRVLVIDDDPALRRALTVALAHHGHEVTTAPNGEQGIALVAVEQPDIVVLDLGLPDLDGVAVCTRVREFSAVPIIVLSAAEAEARKVAALDAGADDYVTKPFGMAELEARIRAALRHRRSEDDSSVTDLVAGPLEIDLVHRAVHANGAALRLTAREFALLAFLARHLGKICTHEMILTSVWGAPYARESGYLHAYVHRLRHKLAPIAGVALETAPGIGYELVTTEPSGTASS